MIMLSVKGTLIAKYLSMTLLFIPLYAMADTQLFSTEISEKTVSKCGTLSEFSACNYMAAGWVITHVSPSLNDVNWKVSDNKSQGFKFIAGRHFKPNWFGELSYSDLGATELTDRLNSSIGTEGVLHKAVSLHIGYLLREHNEQFNVYLKGGASALHKKSDAAGILFKTSTTIKPTLGIGAQWQSTDTGLFARLGVDIYERNTMSAGLLFGYKFGESKTTIVERVIKRPSVLIANPVKKPKIVIKPEPVVVPVIEPPIVKKVLIKKPVIQPAFAGVLKGVNFHTNSAVLTLKAEKILKGVAKQLKQWKGLKVLLIGHTDDVGSHTKNLTLSKNRAISVKVFLIKQGVKAQRIGTAGKGETQPHTSNKTKEGKATNRRVELRAI